MSWARKPGEPTPGMTSRVPLTQVLMYDTVEDRAFWVTPARSWLLLNVYPHLELIEEQDPNYEVILKLAPPQPVIYPPAPKEGPRED